MIDLHTHILPSVDDGSGSVEESLALLRLLARQQVSLVAATPHFYADTDTLGAVSLPSASTGSKGITYLVDSYERTDTDKAVTPKAVNNVYKLVQDKADKSVSAAATLTAAGWSDGVQTLAVSGVTATANGSLRIAQSATDEQFAAWGAAQPRVTAQAAGSLTVKAAGAVPAVDIPVEVVMV